MVAGPVWHMEEHLADQGTGLDKQKAAESLGTELKRNIAAAVAVEKGHSVDCMGIVEGMRPEQAYPEHIDRTVAGEGMWLQLRVGWSMQMLAEGGSLRHCLDTAPWAEEGVAVGYCRAAKGKEGS